MFRYLMKKTGTLILIFVGITFLSFCLTWLSPSDAAEIKLNKTGVAPTEELLELTREEMGLNRPLLIQYGDWLTDFLQGNLGTSLRTDRPVSIELKKAIPQTVLLTFVSMAVVILLSVPTGILCARFKDGMFDRIMRYLTYLFASLPNFFLALIILYVFSVRLQLLPVIASKDAKGIIMPVMVLAFSLSALYIRQLRTIMLDELEKEYVAGARARGVSEVQILFRHVLKNSMMPILTLLGVSLASMLGGTTIVENIFSWQGLGKLAMDAITARDYPVIQGYVVFMALVFLIVNFLVAICYGLIDKRVRSGQEGKA